MSQHAPPPTRAIVLAVSAIFCFSLMDTAVKAVSPVTGTVPALWARYAGQMIIVILLVAPRLRQVTRSQYPKLQIARSVLLMLATFFFFLALGQIGLADATAVMMMNPLLITLGGALFLGEALGPRRIFAILAALLGALIVIRPGSEVFQPASLLPLVAAFCFASYTLITRRLGPDEDVWTSLFYTGLVGAVILSAIVPFHMPALDLRSGALLVMIGAVGTAGQLMLIRALSQAEAGLLAPFNYSGIVFAVVFGFALFDEVPDALTLLGALVIAGAGIYVWHREAHAPGGR
ncbi:DMT family transporter [uncultured Tateyamaria sp.]|uniref:DMT family transporter n=1 Tax=uncultured Tateyamaria sp. TaxID=455651 RepID=UPI00262B6D53|nr:DMT family transporter [uncultured Tateyamaria sp.]